MRKNDNLRLNIDEKEGVFTYCCALAVALAIGIVDFVIPEGNTKVIVSYLSTQIPFLIIPLLYCYWKKINYSAVVPLKEKVKPIGILLAIPITIGAFLQNTILSVSLNNLFIVFGITPSVTLPAIDTPLNIFVAIITVIILPAFAEEFLYRGIIDSAYKEHGVMKTCIISAFIFALSHFNPAQLAHQFVLGFLLSITVALSGSIWYAVIIHLLNNVIALFIGDIIPAYNSLMVLNWTNVLILLAMFVGGAIIVIISFIFFNRTCAKDNLKISGNPFKVFSKKSTPAYYEGWDNRLSPYTLGFIAFMIVMSILPLFIEKLLV